MTTGAAANPYAPAPGYATMGAWGSAPPQQGVWGVSSSQYQPYGATPAPGYPPSYASQQQGAAWTGGGPSDLPLAYAAFDQQAAAARPPLGCWGWGEQWTLFICGILIWPLW